MTLIFLLLLLGLFPMGKLDVTVGAKMESAGFFLDYPINRSWELNTQPNLVQPFRFMPWYLVQNMKSIQEDVQRLWQIDFLTISVIALLSGWPRQKGLRTSHTTKLSTTFLARTLMLSAKYQVNTRKSSKVI